MWCNLSGEILMKQGDLTNQNHRINGNTWTCMEYWILLDIIGCYWILLDVIGCYWMLLDVIGVGNTFFGCWFGLQLPEVRGSGLHTPRLRLSRTQACCTCWAAFFNPDLSFLGSGLKLADALVFGLAKHQYLLSCVGRKNSLFRVQQKLSHVCNSPRHLGQILQIAHP